MKEEFSASRLTKDNKLFPDKLIIEDDKVIFYKGHVIGHDVTSISRGNIGSVTLNSGMFFADIVIETNGGQITRASGFTKSDAKRIIELLG